MTDLAERRVMAPSGSIVEAFDDIVARHGDRTAIVSAGQEVTYRELRARAATIAATLRRDFAGESPHVALLFDQGIDAIAAMLGVGEAGRAYVALDSGEAVDRARFICEDAQASVVLTDARHAALAREFHPGGDPGATAGGAAAEPPADDLERSVAAIFQEILEVPVTSRDDDFFELGGTSMTLAQLQVELRRQLGAQVELVSIVESASVAAVATSLAASRAVTPAEGGAASATVSSLLVPLRGAGHGAPLFLVPGWHGQAFVTPGFLNAVDRDDRPVYSIQAHGLADWAPPLRSVARMADAYLEAIATVPDAERPILVGICAGGVIAVEMARQARAAGRGYLPVIMLDPPYPPHARSIAVRARDLAAFYLTLGPLRFGPMKMVSGHIARRAPSAG